MRMLLGIASLTMLWFFCGTSSALPKETSLPKGLPPNVPGAGDNAKDAKTVAYRQAVKTYKGMDRVLAQDVRSAVARAGAAWEVAEFYRTRSLPLAQRNLELSRESYRAANSIPPIIVWN